jgi:hypothetical protein
MKLSNGGATLRGLPPDLMLVWMMERGIDCLENVLWIVNVIWIVVMAIKGVLFIPWYFLGTVNIY